MNFGEKLKKLREDFGLTQEQLAQKYNYPSLIFVSMKKEPLNQILKLYLHYLIFLM